MGLGGIMLTVCPKCGVLYDDRSSDEADSPDRKCLACWIDARPEMEQHLRPESVRYLSDLRESREKRKLVRS